MNTSLLSATITLKCYWTYYIGLHMIVDSGSLYRWTHSHSPSRPARSLVGGLMAPFYIHEMNPGEMNSRNDSVIMTAP